MYLEVSIQKLIIMKLIYIIAASVIFFLSCNQNKPAKKIASAVFDTAYQTATFTDATRMEKISRVFPVIDSLYKKHAEENHFPGSLSACLQWLLLSV